MAFIAVITAAMCVVAPFSIAIGPIPLSLATLVLYISVGSLGWKRGAVSVVLYILLGAAGMPVFSGFEGGFHKITGVTGGFIIGYIPCGLAMGIISGLLQKGKRKVWPDAIGMAVGTILLYICGTVWFVIQTGSALAAALALCMIPFLPGDAIKIIVACSITPKLRKALNHEVS